MPNWCANTMTISHNDPAMMDKAVEAWNSGNFLATLVPEPDYTTTPVEKLFPEISGKGLADPASAWWDWRVKNWGTKWDIGYDHNYGNKAELVNNSFTVAFDSAWSPPTGAYEKLEDLGYEIRATYYEGGCAFVGAYENGFDECYSIPSDYQEVLENIPEWLDQEYGISNSMAEYATEELMNETNCDTINSDGVLLDGQGNEYRDEQGEIVIVPEYMREHFNIRTEISA